MSEPAAELARRAIAGEPAACAELWRRYRPAVAAVVLAYRPRSELEDLVQEAALAFVRAIASLREPERFEPWLMQIARNVARGSERRVRARPTASLDAPEALVAKAEDAASEDLVTEIAALPAELREPLLLKCLDGLPQRRVAELLGLPETTIETRLVRARHLLRERLALRDAAPPESARSRESAHRSRIHR